MSNFGTPESFIKDDPPSVESLAAMDHAIGSLHVPTEYITRGVGIIIGDDRADQIMCSAEVSVDCRGEVIAARGLMSSGKYRVMLGASLDEDPVSRTIAYENATVLKSAINERDLGLWEAGWLKDVVDVLAHDDTSTLGADITMLRENAPNSIPRTKGRELGDMALPSGTILKYDIIDYVNADEEPIDVVQRAVSLDVQQEGMRERYRFNHSNDKQTLWREQAPGSMSAYASLSLKLSALSEAKVRSFTRELLAAQLEIDLNTSD